MTSKAKRAIKLYGSEKCLEAYRLNRKDGEGCSTIGIYLGMTTRQANSAIDAGAEITEAYEKQAQHKIEYEAEFCNI